MTDNQIVKEAVRAFREGGVVIFPTDTVWGIGAAINQMNAISRLYTIKGRSFDKPTAVLVDGLPMAMRFGRFTRKALELAQKHWPGELTIIVRARKGMVPDIVQGGTDTVGLRVPDSELILNIMNRLGVGIVAGSANFAGETAPRRFALVDQRLMDAVDYVVKPSVKKVTRVEKLMPSTVIDATKSPLKILREGVVRINTNK